MGILGFASPSVLRIESKSTRFFGGGRLRLRMLSQSKKSPASCCLFLALIIPISTPVRGQEQPPRFAVSSIKLSRPDAQMRDMRISISGPNLRVVNCTLEELLLNALQSSRRSEGGPGWVRERRFDILANAEDGTPPNNFVLTQMVLQLLRDRFKLAFHRDSRVRTRPGSDSRQETARSVSVKRRRAKGSSLGHVNNFYESWDGRLRSQPFRVVKYADCRSDRFKRGV